MGTVDYWTVKFMGDTCAWFGPRAKLNGTRINVKGSMSVTLVFVRHAEATHNVDAAVRGAVAYSDPIHIDAALTDTGHEQAYNTVIDGVIDAVYCSPLRRCCQTLLGIQPPFINFPVRLDDRLMEPTGHICNRRVERDELLANVSAVWDMWAVSHTNPYVDEEESIVDFQQRIVAFTHDIVQRHSGQRVLIVSHFQWIRSWFQIFKESRVTPANCQVIETTL